MNPPRVLLVVLVLTALAAASAAGLRLGGERGVPAPGPARAASPRHHVPVSRTPVAVLDAWDVRRAAAWSRGDPAALRSLYVAGSRPGEPTCAMLAGLAGPGAAGAGDADAGARRRAGHPVDADRIVLVVTDRLARAVAAGPADGPAARDAASTRTVVLRRRAGEWRVAGVRERGQPAR